MMPDGAPVGVDEAIVAGIVCLSWWNFVNAVRSRMELGTRGQHVLASSFVSSLIEVVVAYTSRDSTNTDSGRAGIVS